MASDKPSTAKTLHVADVDVHALAERMSYNCGNAMRYLARAAQATSKSLVHLEAALWFLQREVERVKSSTTSQAADEYLSNAKTEQVFVCGKGM
jgi:hypothetical protein